MGDLLGSPRVAPLFPFYDGISMIYVRTCRANRFRPSHFHPDRPIVDRIPRSRSAQTLTFSELRGPSYSQKRLSSLVSPSVRRKDDPSPPLRSSRRDSRFEKKKGPQTLPEGPKNHLANSRFHISPIHPLKWRSNPNPCTKTRIQPYGSKECANFKRGTPSDLDEHPRILA
ncbi:hypothetical protein CK203_044056 [Vitis vinifera]|uniref:Uncharacterized protein n=1 Tax=Vitis vinifera TaxID=29760 RepID=A0A438C7Y6_VITVI|nr:hypothetical protein CK203_116876 [Vitis vinifera]RVW19381.1 hypothetical protein CK203_116875 [Vitis vinifera]RVW19382.1 hypothetical protein CK203_116874 [Vitis vinifera]RVW85496.1 hypothetical protein CK203_044064 [Vitis vinifera]RVW85497.1 hypothetical protein CK203_044065 [Vitis vinifera]